MQEVTLTFLEYTGRLYLLYLPFVKKLSYILSFTQAGLSHFSGRPLYTRLKMYFFSNFKDFNVLTPAQ